jgi:hypothetical protein
LRELCIGQHSTRPGQDCGNRKQDQQCQSANRQDRQPETAPDASHTDPANKTATPTGATTPLDSGSLYVPGGGATQSVIPAQVPGIRVSVYA